MNRLTRTRIGSPDFDVAAFALGGNVFGWTADRDASFAVLDAFVAAGGDFIDTADGYSHWAPGNGGGESETIIGEWLRARGDRDRVAVATKVSTHPEFAGLAADNVRAAADASLQRLGLERIDLYYAHFDDPDIPLAETVEAFSRLVDAGKVRAIGVSNYSAERIDEWFRIADDGGYHRPVALQPHYNLVERGFETNGLRDAAERHRLAVFPYYALASGFLAGKYRDDAGGTGGAAGGIGATVAGLAAGGAAATAAAATAAAAVTETPERSPRAGSASKYLDDRGRCVLAVLDEVAAAHGAEVATVALAWLAARPTVSAPIASARTPEQLPALLASVSLELPSDELDALTAASEG